MRKILMNNTHHLLPPAKKKKKKKPQKTKIKIKIEKVAKDVMLNVMLFTTIKKLKTTHGVEKTQLNRWTARPEIRRFRFLL